MKKSDSSDANERVKVLIDSAERCVKQRDRASADRLFLEAVSIDQSPVSRIAYGVSLADQERYFDAISCLTPVLDSSDRTAIGIVCHNLAAIYRNVGDLDLARRFQWRSTLMQEQAGPADLLGMANEAFVEKHYEVAETLVLTAYESDDFESESAPDGDFVATAALINAELSSPKEGLLLLFSAYRMHRDKVDFRGMGTDQLNMARLFNAERRFRAERSCLIRAIRCFEQAELPYSLAKAQQQLECFERMESIRKFDSRRN